MNQVTLIFEDGVVASIEADEGDTLYLAALKNRIRILTDCLEGDCATCKALCTSGDYSLDDHSDEALSDVEAARREVLTCQMHALSDCVIEFPYESGLALRTKPATWRTRVSSVETVASSVVRLVVEPEDPGTAPAFIPGQYVHLSVPGTGEQRSYSFANPETVTDRHEFFVKILEQGAMSDYLTGGAGVGDEMSVTGPFGRFYLRSPERPLVMVAGGTGLAPMLSMLESLLVSGQTGQPVRLLYGANRADELFSLSDLDSFCERGLLLTTELCVVEPDALWNGARGHITTLLQPDILNGGDCEVYLCGPPPMIEAAEERLSSFGVERARIHAEKFVAS